MRTMTERNQTGIKYAGLHADDAVTDWMKRATQCLRDYPEQKFMTEELRAYAYETGLPKPPSERAWGAVIKEARKARLITINNHRYTSLTRRMAPVWIKL
jgi:hypothetical protein